MKKILFLLSLIIMNGFLFAQNPQQQKIDSVCQLVKIHFKEKNADSIYGLIGEEFKKKISLADFKKICEQNLFPLGEIKETILENYSNGLSKYKAVFALANLSMYLSLDKEDKIATLLFQPYSNIKAKKDYKVPSSNPLNSNLDKEVDSAVQPYMSLKATVGLSIAILKDGVTHYYGYGETERGKHQIPNEHTLFEIGSITKTFTSTLLADAVNAGKIKLDDPISIYLPDSIPVLKYEEEPITIQSLANHSSGIPRMPDNFHSQSEGDPYNEYNVNDLFSFYKNFTPTRKPGTKYEYSNLAVGTLGVILERVNKEKYETMVLNKICKPLHMNETKEFLLDVDSAHFAKGYNANGIENPAWNFKSLQAAGSIRSTSSDLIKYAKANLGEAPKKLYEAIQLTHLVTFSDTENKVGLGWHYLTLDKNKVILHSGETGGYHSILIINLYKKLAVVLLSNCAYSTDDAGAAIMKWLENN